MGTFLCAPFSKLPLARCMSGSELYSAGIRDIQQLKKLCCYYTPQWQTTGWAISVWTCKVPRYWQVWENFPKPAQTFNNSVDVIILSTWIFILPGLNLCPSSVSTKSKILDTPLNWGKQTQAQDKITFILSFVHLLLLALVLVLISYSCACLRCPTGILSLATFTLDQISPDS